MKVPYEEIKDSNHIIIWGTGRVMQKSLCKIDPKLKIEGFCDSNPEKWNTFPAQTLFCWSKEELTSHSAVLIAIADKREVAKVSLEMDEKGINYCHIYDAVKAYRSQWEAKEVQRFDQLHPCANKENLGKIKKFINCHVPYKFCNFQCGYCYVRQHRALRDNKLSLPSPDYVRRALSQIRLGGPAFINFCAGGETMLVKELIPIIVELVKEGHYIQIVTNGTIREAIDRLLDSPIELDHIFIKFSFHYEELIRTGMLKSFYENIHKVREAGCSISVELVASDDLIPLIDSIKKSSLENLGALPHLTIPRDDRSRELKILTRLSMDEYFNTWKQFDSLMFQFKWDNTSIRRFENCMAGFWSFAMDLETGEIRKCLSNPYLDNVYEDICADIHLEKVGSECCLPYCYNCHAYLTLGLIEEVKAPTYYEVRDREMTDGRHWITDTLKDIFNQKLYDNN